jgi:hypothetical protein
MSNRKTNKYSFLVLIIILIIFAMFPIIPVKTSVQVPHQVAKQVPYQVAYQEEEKTEVPIKYDYQASAHETLAGLDWELVVICDIENVDNAGGTFMVTVNFYDGGKLAYSTSDRKYIGPGETKRFELQSKGLAWSTDWRTRYEIKYQITPPTKIESHIVTKYKTEYKTEYVTEYITEQKTEYISLLQWLLTIKR